MPWIESHTEVGRHRKTVLMAAELAIHEAQMVGHLHLLWHAVLEQQEDGNLSEWPDAIIARQAHYDGDAEKFVELLTKYKFLEQNRLIHDWLDYAGRYLTSKYRNANPRRLQEILKVHKTKKRRAKPRLGTVNHYGGLSPLGSVSEEGGCKGGVLPDWLDEKTWAQFQTHRREIKHPMTETQQEALIKKLSKSRERGHDPNAMLEESTANGWQGVFEPKENGRPGKPDRSGRAIIERGLEGAAEFIRRGEDRGS